jgi:hypothetical protein
MFENGAPQAREVDQLSTDVESLCCDWRRMRAVVVRIARSPWWDLRTLSCLYCHAPFEISEGECNHELDCVFDRCCDIVNTNPLPLPDHSVLSEWKKQTSTTWSLDA